MPSSMQNAQRCKWLSVVKARSATYSRTMPSCFLCLIFVHVYLLYLTVRVVLNLLFTAAPMGMFTNMIASSKAGMYNLLAPAVKDRCAMLMPQASAYLGDIADYRQEV